MEILELLKISIFQRALIASLFAGGFISLLGNVIVMFNITTIRFALMHFGLLGGAIGLALGANPLTFALFAIALGSLLFGPLSDKFKVDTGLIGAFFMTGSMALAFLIFYRTGAPALDVFGLFTGSILTLTRLDLYFVMILSIIILLVFIVFYREIQLIFYDPEQAQWLGVPVKRLRNALLFLTGLSVGVAMKVVGALLIDSMILLPAMAAAGLAKNFKQMLILTSVFGIISSTGGLLFSMVYDSPTGVTITLIGVLLLMTSLLIKRKF